MPIIRSSSELQRNFGVINDLAHKTREPIYITRNGESSLVVMDADAFDEAFDLKRRIYDHEIRVYEAVAQSECDFAEGRGMSLEEVRLARAEKKSPQVVA